MILLNKKIIKKLTITIGDPSQYITVPTLLRLPIPLQHPLAYS